MKIVFRAALVALMGCTASAGDSADSSVDTAPVDADGDGWPAGDDCDDADASVNPFAEERCGDGVDADCDGLLGCEDGDCVEDAACRELDCSDGLDDDADGFTDCDDEDCWGLCSPVAVSSEVLGAGGATTAWERTHRTETYGGPSHSTVRWTSGGSEDSRVSARTVVLSPWGSARIRGDSTTWTCSWSADQLSFSWRWRAHEETWRARVRTGTSSAARTTTTSTRTSSFSSFTPGAPGAVGLVASSACPVSAEHLLPGLLVGSWPLGSDIARTEDGGLWFQGTLGASEEVVLYSTGWAGSGGVGELVLYSGDASWTEVGGGEAWTGSVSAALE